MSVVSRPVLIAGNWKMNLQRAETAAFAASVRDFYRSAAGDSATAAGVQALLFPSAPFLATLSDLLVSTPVQLGGQDLHTQSAGAHTGDVSAAQLASAGAQWALCGHSERRADHDEDDALVGRKAAAAVSGGLAPMVCVGETEAEREGGQTEDVLARQLDAALSHCPALVAEPHESQARWALAYEPVWAIGTGKTATPQLAQQAHAFLRQRLEQSGAEAAAIPLLYGGSAKPANCAELVAEPDIDGLLIGGASLDSGSFLDMIRRCGSAVSGAPS